MSKRPEYVRCIKRPMTDDTISWCGRDVRFEFHLTGLDHATACLLKNERVLPCPECVHAVREYLAPYEAPHRLVGRLRV